MNYIKKIVDLGTYDDRDSFDKSKTRTLNTVSLLAFLIISLYIVLAILQNNWMALVLDIVVVATALLILYFHARHEHRSAYFTCAIGFNLVFLLVCLASHPANHPEFFLMVVGVGTATLFEKEVIPKRFFLFSGFFLLVVVKAFYMKYPEGLDIIPYSVAYNWMNALFPFVLVYFLVDKLVIHKVQFKAELEEQRNKVMLLNESLETKVKEKTRTIIEKVNQINRFASISSHDLREPLRNIMSYTQLIQRDIDKREYQHLSEYMTFVKFGIQRMDNLTKDIMTYTSLINEKANVRELDVAVLLESVIRSFQPHIQKMNAKLSVGPMPTLKADPKQFKLLFHNLIENALIYCDKSNPTIHINAEKTEGNWQFEIRDNGVGIDEAYKDLIFKSFKRLENKTHHSGSGIGLTICHKIVQNHGGRIWFDSVLGEGSSFYFTVDAEVVEEVTEYAQGTF